MKPVVVACLLLILAVLSAACATAGLLPATAEVTAETGAADTTAPAAATEPGPSASASPETGVADDTAPAVMPALPGSGKTSDPSANLDDLVDVAGVAKEVKDRLVLITTADGGEFMLRFSQNTVWDEGVSQTIEVGNEIACQIKPEPTLTTPAQGEVFVVTKNEKP